MKPTIYFASDHAGFALKNELVAFVERELGFTVVDFGANTLDLEDDFTDYVAKAAREVSASKNGAKAIILGGSGQGEAMLANRFHNVRACVFYGGDTEIVRLSREHNDANVLSLGARFVDLHSIKDIVALWLSTPHVPVLKYDRRNEEIDTLSFDGPTIHLDGTIKGRSLVPSLPAASFTEIEMLLESLEGVAFGVQIDLVDGMFAKNVSWPFTELDVYHELHRLQKFAEHFEIEIDAMCLHTEQYLDVFASLPIDRLIIHADSTKAFEYCSFHAKKHGYKLGLGILNSTPLEVLTQNKFYFDFVQVMGIEKIGVQGQSFDEKTIETVASIHKLYPDFEIAVDGGVNATTIPKLLKAGARRFAPGSAISKASNPASAFIQLSRLIGL